MRIAVLFGGVSEEREISIASAAQIIPALRALGHEVVAVDAMHGPLLVTEENAVLTTEVSAAAPESQAMSVASGPGALSAGALNACSFDVVFLALHGGSGEDGRIQSMLSLAGVPYTGSNHIASALTMDKDLSKRIVCAVGVPTAAWLMHPAEKSAVSEILGWPVVVKPNKQGSTVGLTVVHAQEEFDAAVKLAARFDDEVMLEKYIPGREFTVGIIDGRALPVGEILVPGEVFDYRAKYQLGGAREIFPADISEQETALLQNHALRAHMALKLGSYSRVDFRRDNEGMYWFLEANSLPGMTATSLLPQAAKAAGISFPALLERICRSAVRPRS